MSLWINLFLFSTLVLSPKVLSLKYDESELTLQLRNQTIKDGISPTRCNISCENITDAIGPCFQICSFAENSTYENVSLPDFHGKKETYVYNPTSLCQTTEKSEVITVLYWTLKKNIFNESQSINFTIDIESVNSLGIKDIFEINTVNDTLISIALKPDITFRFNVTTVTIGGAIDIATSKWLRTRKDDNLAAPGSLSVHNQLQATGKFVQIEISWVKINMTDLPCFYNVYCLAVNSTSASYVEKFVRNPEELLKPLTIDGLSYNTLYEIRISSTNFDNSKESEYSTFVLKTKSCLQLNNNSFYVCGPPKPQNLMVKKIFDKTLSITWDPPKFTSLNNSIIHYQVDLSHDFYSENLTPEVYFVNGNTSHFELSLNEELYSSMKISVSSVSEGGVGDSAHYIFSHHKQGAIMNTTIIIGIVLGILTLAPIIAVTYFVLCKRLNGRSIVSSASESHSGESWVSPLKKKLLKECPYQIDINLVCIKNSLGTGAFGVVYEGTAMIRGVEERVAVKMLKENASEEAQTCLLEEIEMLRFLGHHPHIVTLQAYVINGPILALLVEYCPLGDLKNYLDNIRNKELKSTLMNSDESGFGSMNSWPTDENSQNSFRSESDSEVSNPSYFLEEIEDEDPQKNWNFFYKKFISFSRQIAIGMEFLASNRIIHRDLAARNILLLTSDHVKITDFGLSKDIYENGIYCKKSVGGMLPVKWMALESIISQTYTSQSDVWSFGILLWEIFSIGGTPYPGISNKEVIPLIQTGYRMEKPNHATAEIYNIMKSCWKENANSRPSFLNLKSSIETILESFESYDNVIAY